MNDPEKLPAVMVAMEGKALTWYQWWEFSADDPTWSKFRSTVIRHFQPSMLQSSFELLPSLKQTGSVEDYREQFELYVGPLKCTEPAYLKGIFMNGLKEVIRAKLKLHLVEGLTELMDYAQRVNEKNNLLNKGNGNCSYPPVYPIGPITHTGPSDPKSGCECLLWLDKQPPNSVLYVSFGSGGTLCQEQINELALGLELSRHKFLWVNLRAPNDRASATYFSDGGLVDDPLHFLPLGFIERTKGQGLVMCGWAPQVEVLGHKSIGAFLTHCGWNSVLESVVHGVPMMAWPLFAEQRTNAALVTDGLKVAVRPNVDTSGNSVVVKEEIVKLIKSLMEGLVGEEIRRRMKELQKFAECAVMKDGSSTRTICKLAHKWKSLGRP